MIRLLMDTDETVEGIRLDQGHVSAKDYDIGNVCRKHRKGASDSISGSVLGLLVGKKHIPPGSHSLPYGIGLVADHHHHVPACHFDRGFEHIGNHRSAGQGMQDLGTIGLHAGAFSCRKDNDTCLRLCHDLIQCL
jgi:hypothetical protein